MLLIETDLSQKKSELQSELDVGIVLISRRTRKIPHALTHREIAEH
jgi:hypothetical protein